MTEEATDTKIKPWQLAEIVEPVQCRLMTLPESMDSFSKVGCFTLPFKPYIISEFLLVV